MKKVLSILLISIIVLSINVDLYAGPALLELSFDGFCEFNELRDTARYGTDEELHELIHGRMRRGIPFYWVGLSNRNEIITFVDTVGRAFIPILHDSVGSDGTIWQISVPRGVSPHAVDEGRLTVRYCFANRMTITFESFYGFGLERTFTGVRSIDAFEAPAAVRNGVEFYYLDSGAGWDDFVILIDEYMLWARFGLTATPTLSPEEKLEILFMFTFARFDNTIIDSVVDENTLLLMRSGIFIAASISVLVVIMICTMKFIFFKHTKKVESLT